MKRTLSLLLAILLLSLSGCGGKAPVAEVFAGETFAPAEEYTTLVYTDPVTGAYLSYPSALTASGEGGAFSTADGSLSVTLSTYTDCAFDSIDDFIASLGFSEEHMSLYSPNRVVIDDREEDGTVKWLLYEKPVGVTAVAQVKAGSPWYDAEAHVDLTVGRYGMLKGALDASGRDYRLDGDVTAARKRQLQRLGASQWGVMSEDIKFGVACDILNLYVGCSDTAGVVCTPTALQNAIDGAYGSGSAKSVLEIACLHTDADFAYYDAYCLNASDPESSTAPTARPDAAPTPTPTPAPTAASAEPTAPATAAPTTPTPAPTGVVYSAAGNRVRGEDYGRGLYFESATGVVAAEKELTNSLTLTNQMGEYMVIRDVTEERGRFEGEDGAFLKSFAGTYGTWYFESLYGTAETIGALSEKGGSVSLVLSDGKREILLTVRLKEADGLIFAAATLVKAEGGSADFEGVSFGLL